MKDEVTAYIKEHLDEFLKKPKLSECSYPIQYLFIQIENSQNGMYFVDDLDELENIFGITTDPIEEMKKLQDEIDALHLSHYIELHHPYRTEDTMITVYGGLEQAINRDELNAEMIIKDFMVDTDAIVSEMLPCELRNTQTSGSFLMINNIMDIISSKENIELFLKYSEDSELTRYLNDFKNKWFEGDLSVEMIVPELNLNNQRTERR